MGKIIVSENVSLDGVGQDPTGDEGFRVGGWFGRIDERDHDAWAEAELDEALGAEALLLGRRTYEFFAARWPSRTGRWADRLNSLPKHVVSATLHDPKWNNTTVLAGDPLREVDALRRNVDGDIVVYGSFRLVHALVEHDLVDELRVMVFPFVLGPGARPFGEISGTKRLRLVDVRTVGDGLALLTYERRPGR
ncbi:dihydrofolate reductase family protein [Mycobacterium sp. IS-1264]|uniref:dihydrofolate reductase family protein n=1 Tax=Mycobacterium sp. IS-1264 TaxID=1834158 RepID=UPI00096C2B3F|nr:dihydrofolate reductase family protein [Mycobacterium sp. IS-1264]OMC42037.1 deaminase [Mycobacterium sp. IS-1264]